MLVIALAVGLAGGSVATGAGAPFGDGNATFTATITDSGKSSGIGSDQLGWSVPTPSLAV